MSRYFEFTTASQNPHTGFTRGNPVHDGALPTRFKEVLGVRVDGREIEFSDASIVDSLHRTLRTERPWLRSPIPMDCTTFSALMHGVELTDPQDNPFRETTKIPVSPDSAATVLPVNLGVSYASEITRYNHTVTPAHTLQEPQYLHKLGDAGPVCLSGLTDAMLMYKCDVAHEVILPANDDRQC